MENDDFNKTVNNIFREFEKFQSQVLDLLNSDRNKFFESINELQNKINMYNEILRTSIDELVAKLNAGVIPIEDGLYWNERLKVIMDNLAMIYFEMEKMKSEMKNEANLMKKGKTAIMSYHSKQNQRPFFLSHDA
jgi:hypothetical protein